MPRKDSRALARMAAESVRYGKRARVSLGEERERLVASSAGGATVDEPQLRESPAPGWPSVVGTRKLTRGGGRRGAKAHSDSAPGMLGTPIAWAVGAALRKIGGDGKTCQIDEWPGDATS
jgi:hypothetical protein